MMPKRYYRNRRIELSMTVDDIVYKGGKRRAPSALLRFNNAKNESSPELLARFKLNIGDGENFGINGDSSIGEDVTKMQFYGVGCLPDYTFIDDDGKEKPYWPEWNTKDYYFDTWNDLDIRFVARTVFGREIIGLLGELISVKCWVKHGSDYHVVFEQDATEDEAEPVPAAP